VAVKSTSTIAFPVGLSNFTFAFIGTLIGRGDLFGMGIVNDCCNFSMGMGQGGKAMFTGVLTIGILKVQFCPQAAHVKSKGMMDSTVDFNTILEPAVIGIDTRSI